MLGSTEIRGGPVTLDFGAGLIRHAATVDADGIEWSHGVLHQLEASQLEASQLSSTGTFVGREY